MTKKQEAEKAIILLRKMTPTDQERALGIMEGMIIARDPSSIEAVLDSDKKGEPAA